ncbi:phosphatidylinositol-specific phospholipase C/glycerophosphodiester phosphodiesterase family protein [Streptomyces cyaneofuscatus]|uniref:phosphatidylinositol-specific phospholipase C/glycerophosphodiester phosphodiesterase family protein n=1 Tax=Streptomyces cyaneofuscatus TaxID=66883 RepID=UPI002D7697F1|nr:phosphatidylinositol-specific phospholipase C/glycerophosphodiester phosphodiesterase family protein [Streptomyces cyaneofuscatus]WRO14406.1 phosphatidylinositol-specific phospholipase C/glycerophosphodiester phosphodiesterase family protein [Streptomyces cyaneofuscatus]
MAAPPAPTRRRALTVTLATAAAVIAAPAGVAAASPAAASPATAGRPSRPRPLRHAHAHNDYLHPRPLHDALAHGFTSVEADIFLVDGELLVAHDPAGLDPSRTLAGLYLEPLRALVWAGHGSVYPHHRRPLQLLIDIKADGVATYRELDRQLTRYGSLFTRYHHGRVRPGAVTAVISGDRAARVPMEAQRTRLAFYDGRLDDLGSPSPASFTPLISANWTQTFGWLGAGAFPRAERDRLRTLVRAAHREGRRIRFWATPDLPGPEREAVWNELLAAGVDHLNTDDLAGLERFLRARTGAAPTP